MALPDAALALLALHPSRFVAERDALAAALAREGDAAGAAAVRKLRRPVGLAWVLNRLARERPREVEALIAAGVRLRAGQRRAVAGSGAEEMRAASAELQEKARELRAAIPALTSGAPRRLSQGELGRAELLLRVAASAPDGAGAELRRGALVREPAAGAAGLGGLAVLSGGTPTPAGGGPPSGRGAARREESATSRRDAAARERAVAVRQARELAAARRELARAEARAARAARAAASAEARARALRQRAETASADAAARRSALREP